MHDAYPRGVFVILLFEPVAGANFFQQMALSSPAVPIQRITAILDAFKSHDVVALGEGAARQRAGSPIPAVTNSRSQVACDGQ